MPPASTSIVDRFPDQFPPPFADTWGDDEYGLWVEFEIPARNEGGAVVQRLRWIEPGTFLMGSPEDEPERLVPQHSEFDSLPAWSRLGFG